MQECQFVTNADRVSNDDNDEDDDDFEDDEEQEAPKKWRVSNLAKLLCSMRPTINEKLKEEKARLQKEFFGKIEEFTSAASRMNVYYHFDEMRDSFALLCSGIELRQPLARFQEGRFVLTTALAKEPMRMDEWCDNRWQELDRVHPSLILENKA
jgi:hypothetical protein